MKDTKYIRRDCHSVDWVMPQGRDFFLGGGVQGVTFFKHGCVAYQIDGDDEQNRMQSKKEGKHQESIQSSTTPDPGYKFFYPRV